MLRYYYPLKFIDHEDYDLRYLYFSYIKNVGITYFTPFLELPTMRIVKSFKIPQDLKDEFNNLKIKLMVIVDWRSNSGAHVVQAYNLEPTLKSRKHNFYAVEVLYQYESRERYENPTDLFDEAYYNYVMSTDKPNSTNIGAFVLRARKGYYKALLVRQVNTDEFVNALEEFNLVYFFDLIRYI
jgi:hypothetical protein